MVFFMAFHPKRQCVSNFFLITYVKWNQFAGSIFFFNNCHCLFSLREIGAKIYENMITQGGEFYADCPANSPGSASNECALHNGSFCRSQLFTFSCSSYFGLSSTNFGNIFLIDE